LRAQNPAHARAVTSIIAEREYMIRQVPGGPVSTTFSAQEADLIRITLGRYIIHAFSNNSWLQAAVKNPYPGMSEILAPGAKIVDFSGYYVSGPKNPTYAGRPPDQDRQAETYVSHDETKAEFLPSTADDWRPWPWHPDVEPYVQGIHGSDTGLAFASHDLRTLVVPWAVGAWIGRADALKTGTRPLTDPVVLIACNAARSRQTMADQTGRLAWGPTGDITTGAQAISLTDASAGVQAITSLYPTDDGRPGRFRSAYPRGPAGDLIRWAYRERFGTGDTSWMAEQFEPSLAVPKGIRARQIKGPSRFFGLSFYDERDWNSREDAFGPARIGSGYVTWAPNRAYRPGTPRELDPQTGKILNQAEPWRVNVRARLPFNADNVILVTWYFVDGHFTVTDPDSDVSYFESPPEFGSRLRREAGDALATGLTGHLSRAVVLLTDNEPVPQWAAREVAGGLRDYDVITVSMPATMFLDDHPGAGVPETRIALLPGSSEAGPPIWTRTSPTGISAELTAATLPASGDRSPRTLTSAAPWPGRAVPMMPDLPRPQDLIPVRQILQAGTGLTPGPLRSGRPGAGESVIAVRGALGIDFVSGPNWEQHLSPVESLQADGVFELLEINGEYDPGTPMRTHPVTRRYPLSAWPMLPVSRHALPSGAGNEPLHVFADYYGGRFLLSTRSDASQITTWAASPPEFGRRIRAALVLALHGPGTAARLSRPVVLLARHRAVPPQVADAVAQELLGASGALYTASMPATAYTRESASGTITALALIRLPGETGEPYWTLTTPLGTTSRIDAPPLRQQTTPQVSSAGRTARQQPLQRVAYGYAAEARDRPRESIELTEIQRVPGRPYGTLPLPPERLPRTDSPPPRQQPKPQAFGAVSPAREQPSRQVAYNVHRGDDGPGSGLRTRRQIGNPPAPGSGRPARTPGTQASSRRAPSDAERPAESIELTEIQRAPGHSDDAGVPGPPPHGQPSTSGPPAPERTFPPLFLESLGGALQYPMGTLGEYVQLGNAPLSDHQALADLVADALPPGHEALRQNLADQVKAVLQEKGSQLFVQEILERPVQFAPHPHGDPARAAQTVAVRLGLGNPARAHQVTDPDNGRRPAGQHRSLPWDSEQIASGGSNRAVTTARQLWAELAQPDMGRAIPRVRVTAGSATTFTSATSASVAERRFTKGARADIEDVDDAFFLFPEGVVMVRPEGLQSGGQPAGQRLPVLLSFPENLCPPKGWRPLSGEKLGVTQDQVTRDEVVGHDSVRGQDVRAAEAAERIAKLLLSVAAQRERVAGLAQLAADVWARLAGVVGDADQDHKGDIETNLSESSVLRRWLGIIGSGAVSPVIGRSQHGPRLIVEASLRNVQALTEDDIPVNEENSRQAAATSTKAESGTLSVTGSAELRSGPTNVTVHGKTLGIRGTGQVKGTGSLTSARQQNATISYQDVRNLKHRGPSIRYRAELHVTVKIASTDCAAEAMPEVAGAIVATIRIPKRQQAGFEFAIREALSPSGRQPSGGDEPGSVRPARHPTAALASGKGAGFAMVSGRPGAEKVLPAILRMVMNLDRRTAWAQPWTGRDYADAFAILEPDYGTQALVAASVAPSAGLRAEWSRPAVEGNELINVLVTVLRAPQPASSGRTENATLVISSASAQGSHSSADTMVSGFSLQGAGGLEVDYDLGNGRSGSFAASGGAGLSITSTAGTQAGHSVTRFPITTYNGPVHYWDYDLSFSVDVTVSHELGTTPADWVPVFARAARSRFTRRAGDESIPLLTLGDDEARQSGHADLPGSLRLAVPEPMTHAAQVPQHVLDETGVVQVIRNPRRPRDPAGDATIWQKLSRHVLPRQLQPGHGQLFRTVPVPDVLHYLGPGGHARLTQDDRVIEIGGAEAVGSALTDLLHAGGISKVAYGDLPWKVAEPGQLAAHGPSVIMTTVVQDGRITNRHATIKIAGYPTRLAPVPAGPVPADDYRASGPLVLSSEETDLGGSFVSSTIIKEWTRSLIVASDLDNEVGAGNTDVNLPVSEYTWSLAPSIAPRTVTDAATPGYQLYETRTWREHVEDMVWLIAVVYHDKNILYRSRPFYSATIATVRRGISFLRLADPIPDPRIASGLAPTGIARLIHAGGPAPVSGPQAPRATRMVPLMPVTPASSELIPAVPVLPNPSVTERLLPLPDPGGRPGNFAAHEPLLALVRQELAAKAPEHLEDFWTLEAPGLPAERQLSGSLRRLFSLDYIRSISDAVLGGWVTARPTRSVPGASDVAEIWVSARRLWGQGRPPGEGGYKFLESVPAAEIGRDIWRHHIVRAGRPWLFTRSGQTMGLAGPWHTGAGINPIRQLDKAGGRGTADAVWDSVLLQGADRYGGEWEFRVLVDRTLQPSRAANTLLLNVPRFIFSSVQGAGNLSRQKPFATVTVAERALVPRAVNNDGMLRLVTPPGAAAIEPVPATGPTPGRLLPISAGDLRSGESVNLGWDQLKLQQLSSLVLRDLARLEHIHGMPIPWVGVAFEHGATALLAAAAIISYPMFQAFLPEMAENGGKTFPALTREGGPVTDTTRELTVQVQFIDPQPIDAQPGRPQRATRNSSTYHLTERQPQLFHNSGMSGQLRTSLTEHANFAAEAEASAQRGTFSDLKVMPVSRAQAHTSSIAWLPLSVDALVTVTVGFRNTRGKINVTSRRPALLRYRVRNGLVLGLSPALGIKHGLQTQGR
jgi:hypothetical protein